MCMFVFRFAFTIIGPTSETAPGGHGALSPIDPTEAALLSLSVRVVWVIDVGVSILRCGRSGAMRWGKSALNSLKSRVVVGLRRCIADERGGLAPLLSRPSADF